MDIVSKKCNRCKEEKPASDFYKRAGTEYLLSECKECIKGRGKTQVRVPKTQALVQGEILALDYLKRKGIPTLPGKAVSAADVDLVSYGACWIETKHARLHSDGFMFSTSSTQQARGFLADIVLLICEHSPDDITFHFLPANHPAFYNKHGKVKQGISFVPGRTEDMKRGKANTWRTVLTQQMMDSAQDATWLIDDKLQEIKRRLMAGEVLPFELSKRAS